MRESVNHAVLVVIVAGIAWTGSAQTNLPSVSLQWLAVSEPHLRSESKPTIASDVPKDVPEASAPVASGTPATSAALTAVAMSSALDRNEVFHFKRQDLNLIIPPPSSPEPSRNLIVRGLDSVFLPDEFRMGRHVTMSCSVVTAVKRKNPFCLLNPFILQVWW